MRHKGWTFLYPKTCKIARFCIALIHGTPPPVLHLAIRRPGTKQWNPYIHLVQYIDKYIKIFLSAFWLCGDVVFSKWLFTIIYCSLHFVSLWNYFIHLLNRRGTKFLYIAFRTILTITIELHQSENKLGKER